MRKVFLTLISLFICLYAEAQFHFGPQISMNITSITNMGSELNMNTEPHAKVGFAVGGFAEYSFSDLISVQADLLYSQQGVSLGRSVLNPYNAEEALYETPGKVKIRTHYINLPIKAKFTYKDHLFAFIGPQFGLCLGGTRVKDGDKLKINSELNTFDCGMIVGAGWQFDFGLNLGISYNISFDNTFRETGKTSKNRVFAITAGWRIR